MKEGEQGEKVGQGNKINVCGFVYVCMCVCVYVYVCMCVSVCVASMFVSLLCCVFYILCMWTGSYDVSYIKCVF